MIVVAGMPTMSHSCGIVSSLPFASISPAIQRDRWIATTLRVAPVRQQSTLRVVLTDTEREERLAYAIAEAMRRRRLTPPKVAQMIGKSADTVRRWANGRNGPSALDIDPLAAALGVDPMYLIRPPEIPAYPLDAFLVDEVSSPEQREAEAIAAGQALDEQGQTRAGSSPRPAPRRAREQQQ
jgi:transcriptional regulator with XRE-family HTH domain